MVDFAASVSSPDLTGALGFSPSVEGGSALSATRVRELAGLKGGDMRISTRSCPSVCFLQ
eukprot:168022-Prorocentrum_minimum.AAC.1